MRFRKEPKHYITVTINGNPIKIPCGGEIDLKFTEECDVKITIVEDKK